MSRHNQIPLRMKVDGLKLSPASAFDQEVLASYQSGAVLQVYLWQGRNPDLLRKFWAIVSKVVDTCATPWEDKEEAADALKLALGITDVGSTVNGQMFVRPGSISFSAMDEAHFRKFFEDSMALLSKVTGVDVIELGREAADTGPDHDPSTGEIIEHETTESGSTIEPDTADAPAPERSAEGVDPSLSIPSQIADATETPVADLASVEDPAGGETAPSQPPAGSPLPSDQRAMLIEAATKFMKLAQEQISFESRLQFLESREADWKDVIDQENWPKLESLATAARAVINSKRTPAQAFSFMAEVLGCTVAGLGG